MREPVVQTEQAVETVEQEGESHGTGTESLAVDRNPTTIFLDMRLRRAFQGGNSIASRTQFHARVAENTITFESHSGGSLGEPNTTALRSNLRQIMIGFGELSSIMETEADSESIAPNHADASGTNSNANLVGHLHRVESPPAQLSGGNIVQERMEMVGIQEEPGAQAGLVAGDVNSTDSDLVEDITIHELQLLQLFLLDNEEDDELPQRLTKEQIDNLSTRTYDQASVEEEVDDACCICINEYTQGNKLRLLPCSHEFHIHCIDHWLSENNTCPLCRQPILAAHQY
ncbi:E3 ubiquitin-protein ligase RNF6-like [Gouania willdenowi]|uniref:E3 ubiquitin-protein ligase RNF6-like n=1 Tax=Gouania willdenowi TaxID=441366 RepID=UPI00105478D9|nr:E3 ubiquitin-protein ligase RNF6-like [Gouania willdenowi]